MNTSIISGEEYRVYTVVHRALDMEWLFWSLSTLGGAISAMADYLPSFIDKARLVSFKQLHLASFIGDPVLISRCKLFIALSLAQKNRIKAAADIVR
ncbi:unnamed protein product [Enterobius vermicularis]|uniref:SAM domain-containing protein n=1 Tax=Enterobius vermicularis TaxID=51028 RepID=A0A0N4V5F2_ENTVE|nr:unnamed protein product [Enterobius vermicularis]